MFFRVAIITMSAIGIAQADEWKNDSLWHDGLVEKATYLASRPIYGKDRQYEAVIFTNKEQHDLKTLTKASGSTDTVEVWKHNLIEVVPTPNYDYTFATTTHMTAGAMELTRLDCSSQEFCGTSFKQFLQRPGSGSLDYFAFSYMPEAGRVEGKIDAGGRKFVPVDSLGLWLRDYDFVNRPKVSFSTIVTQKSNRPTSAKLMDAQVTFAGEEADAFKLEVHAAGQLIGSYWMAKDRLHVMVRAELADGQKYALKQVQRVDYWTIVGE